MKALLLVAHGSRRQSSNDEIRTLTTQLRQHNPRFDLVEYAFLEMAEPTIAQGGDKLAANGANEIIVLPYFLAAGNHVATDIPAEVAQIQQRHPSLKITIAPHIGAATNMARLIQQHLPPSATE